LLNTIHLKPRSQKKIKPKDREKEEKLKKGSDEW
jgi:hypothetical protein